MNLKKSKILKNIKRTIYCYFIDIKKHLWCRFFHRHHRCYYEVNKLYSNKWHCAKCWDCQQDVLWILEDIRNEKY